MNSLVSEALCIALDFDTVTFVGAIAVMLHTGEQRQSQDLDFVVAEKISNDKFLEKGYKTDPQKDEIFTPNGYKIDVYYERDLNEIPLKYIIETAVTIKVNKKENTVNVISLEGLIVSKFRAKRDQDIDDLKRLAIRCSSRINWNEIKNLTKNDVEYSYIKKLIQINAST